MSGGDKLDLRGFMKSVQQTEKALARNAECVPDTPFLENPYRAKCCSHRSSQSSCFNRYCKVGCYP